VAAERWGERLAEIAAGHGLDREQRERLQRLLVVLWATSLAPTSVRQAGRAVDVHVADALAALEVPAVRSSRRIVDIGSGAGFPGLPLAVALPAADVRLLESQRRKCEHLRRMVAELQVDALVVCERAESWVAGRGEHDLALARAVGPQPLVLEYAAPLLRIGGKVLDWRGKREGRQEAAGRRAAEELGLELVEVRRVEPFAGARDHHLHVFAKVAATPERYPRRPGMARKRPLGGS
jgi:16S rRNA (guanine527-N7)-methyltransferase